MPSDVIANADNITLLSFGIFLNYAILKTQEAVAFVSS